MELNFYELRRAKETFKAKGALNREEFASLIDALASYFQIISGNPVSSIANGNNCLAVPESNNENEIPRGFISLTKFRGESTICKALRINSTRLTRMINTKKNIFKECVFMDDYLPGCPRYFVKPKLFEDKLKVYPFKNKLEKEALQALKAKQKSEKEMESGGK